MRMIGMDCSLNGHAAPDTRKHRAPTWRFPFTEVPEDRLRREAEGPSGFAQNGLDRADGNPIDLGNLGRLHSVFHQSLDARKLRPRDLGRRLLLGADRCFDFLVMDQRRRRGCQHARFARRLVGQRGVRNQLLVICRSV